MKLRSSVWNTVEGCSDSNESARIIRPPFGRLDRIDDAVRMGSDLIEIIICSLCLFRVKDRGTEASLTIENRRVTFSGPEKMRQRLRSCLGHVEGYAHSGRVCARNADHAYEVSRLKLASGCLFRRILTMRECVGNG